MSEHDSGEIASLEGHLLVAAPELNDPNFARSVVLIIHHNEEGAFGLVLTQPTQVTVAVNGVGYEILIPLSSFDRLPPPGQEVKLLTHLAVREDAHTLYGFMTAVERELFRMLSWEQIASGAMLSRALGGVAAGKLQGIVRDRPWVYRGQNIVNLTVLGAALVMVVLLVIDPGRAVLFPIIVAVSLVFGVMLVIRIGGADMPTVISLLNSYAGLSAAMMGYVLDNKLLIIAGALDGSSGLILSIIMCRAMNRSFTNVLFGAFGTVQATRAPACISTRPHSMRTRSRAMPTRPMSSRLRAS